MLIFYKQPQGQAVLGKAKSGCARGHTHLTYLMLMLRSMLLLLLLPTAAAAPLPCKHNPSAHMLFRHRAAGTFA